jgi:low affinity Fe/Cu permease
MWITALTLVVAATLLVGCGSVPNTVVEGSHERLPGPHAKTVVWGNHQAAVWTASAWLQAQGLQVVDPAVTQKKLSELHLQLSCTRADVLILEQASRELGADFVIYIETTINPLLFRRPIQEESAKAVAATETRYGIQLTVQGVDVKTAAVVSKGRGRTRYPVSAVDAIAELITARALAAALGEAQEGSPNSPSFTEAPPARGLIPLEPSISCPHVH